MKRILIAGSSLLLALSLTACSTNAPQYSPVLDNVAAIKKASSAKAKVGAFSSAQDKQNANPISLRGNSMNSPYDSSYAAYVAEALKQELTLAGSLSPDASTVITGTLLKNELDASGFSKGNGIISARFVVSGASGVKYDKVKSANHEWDSSFVGAVAIPNAIGAYPVLVSKLLAALYADPDFSTALNKEAQ
ncbi:hypothetical protein [Massilia endophytica]|uniref:hypothetical protein n=1 Tax=Massilia endophytica TaxID=2899220 RepID=UPI001E453316|nr:hypothetical protein [Massilia endophytica]UGQ46389.1 hypothetical protein LSQ66_21915 [Massilia endophytica]